VCVCVYVNGVTRGEEEQTFGAVYRCVPVEKKAKPFWLMHAGICVLMHVCIYIFMYGCMDV